MKDSIGEAYAKSITEKYGGIDFTRFAGVSYKSPEVRQDVPVCEIFVPFVFEEYKTAQPEYYRLIGFQEISANTIAGSKES